MKRLRHQEWIAFRKEIDAKSPGGARPAFDRRKGLKGHHNGQSWLKRPPTLLHARYPAQQQLAESGREVFRRAYGQGPPSRSIPQRAGGRPRCTLKTSKFTRMAGDARQPTGQSRQSMTCKGDSR